MDEIIIQNIVIARVVLIACFVYLYSLGGVVNKAFRRFGCPLVLLAGILFCGAFEGTFKWLSLASVPLLIGALHLGYGGEELWKKIFKRAYCGLACAVAILPLAISSGLLALWFLHLAICLSFSIILGAVNIARNARQEEALIGLSYCAIPLFMV